MLYERVEGTLDPDLAGVLIEWTREKGLAVLAIRPLDEGECVVVGRPIGTTADRTQHSLQKTWDTHVDLDAPARYMNHSCAPNTGVVDNEFGGYSFVALRAIAAGEELTWDYETTEYVSISVARCLCGSAGCCGTIRGYRYRYENTGSPVRYLADYLRVGSPA